MLLRRKNLYLLMTFFMVCLNLFIIGKYLNLRNNQSKVNEECVEFMNLIRFYRNKEKVEIKFRNASLGEEIFLDKEKWKDYIVGINGNIMLVLVFSELNCDVCVEEVIKILKENIQHENINNVVLLADYDKQRYFDIFMRINQVNFKAFRIDLNLFKEIIPYDDQLFLVLDENLGIKNIFIPDKTNLSNTKCFLRFVNDIMN